MSRKIESNIKGGFPLYVTEKVFANRKKGKRIRVVVACGCCRGMKRLDIYPTNKEVPRVSFLADTIEIGGIYGTVLQWRKLLLPILGIKVPGKK